MRIARAVWFMIFLISTKQTQTALSADTDTGYDVINPIARQFTLSSRIHPFRIA
jgi:hypothetical protein